MSNNNSPRTGVGAIFHALSLIKTPTHHPDAGVRLLDPRTIVLPGWVHARSLVEDRRFQALKSSIQQVGRNVQPIKLRPFGNGGSACHSPSYQLVLGAGRLQAARELGLPVLAFSEEVVEQSAFVEFFVECRQPQAWRPWPLALTVRTAVETGLFPSLRRLRDAVGGPLSDISLLWSLALLPAETLAIIERLPVTRPVAMRLVAIAGRDPGRLIGLSQTVGKADLATVAELVRRASSESLL